MKRCPECRRDYVDDTLLYCLEDGAALVQGSVASSDEPQTAILHDTASRSETETRGQVFATDQTAVLPSSVIEPLKAKTFDKRLLLAPIALGVILLGGVFAFQYATQAKQIESIAVMPFVNETGNADVEYLSDGLTETLITGLSNLPNLNVKPRSSVFRYKGKDSDPRTIGSELNVQAILNGRVVQRGQDVSLFIELIDVALDKVVWSKQYTRSQTDIVSLQRDIARDVSNRLESKLSSTDLAKVEKNSKVNSEAYELYLKGLFQFNRRTGDAYKQAAELFSQAIEKDPNYAPAYVGLGKTLRVLPVWSLASPKDTYPKLKAAALRALELDDTLADAHGLFGKYLELYEWDRVAAEREYRLAIELDPNNPNTHALLNTILWSEKRFDEAIAAARREVELDPLSKRTNLTQTLIHAGRYNEAITNLNEVLADDPNYADTYWIFGMAYYGKSLYGEASASLQKYIELDNDPVGRSFLALSQAKVGNRDEAVKQLEWLKQESSQRYISGMAFAVVYIALGNKDEALTALEKEVEDRSPWALELTCWAMLDDVRDEPRFKALLKRMNLQE